MDEDLGVRLTRSRRRQSMEQNDEVTTSAPSTPTKKRATKLAKPQLDDIVENAVVESPRRNTRRSVVPEVTVSVEATRTATPAVHAARSRSNTSLLSESALAVESPRNKRASRRNSLAGSDTESATVTTPARRSRRISKEFTKSPDTSAEAKIPAKITKKRSTSRPQEAIVEENDKEEVIVCMNLVDEDNGPISNSQTSSLATEEKEIEQSNVAKDECSVEDQNSPMSARKRKSPRLSSKKNIIHNSLDETELGEHENIPQSLNGSNKKDESIKKNKKTSLNKMNKSLPIILDNNDSIFNKKFRTKSLTNFESKSLSNIDAISFFSDNESRQVKLTKNKKGSSPQGTILLGTKEFMQSIDINGSKSCAMPSKVEENKENEVTEVLYDNSLQVDSSMGSHKKKSNCSGKLQTNISGIVELDVTVQTKGNYDIEDKTKKSISKQQCSIDETSKIFSTIIMDDSDIQITSETTSDTNEICKNNKTENKSKKVSVGSVTNLNSDSNLETEVVSEKKIKKSQVSFEKENKEEMSETSDDLKNQNIKAVNVFMSHSTSVFDNTCEPMDIDETLPENIESHVLELKNTSTGNSHKKEKNYKTLQKSTQIYDKEINSTESCDVENTKSSSKSTFILSRNSYENVSAETTSKSNKKKSKNATPKSKSFDLNIKKDSDVSAAAITSNTPLQNKILQNNGVYTSTPVSTLIDGKVKNQPKPETSIRSKILDKVNSDNDTSSSDEDRGCVLEDDEAEDAGNDYQSGDSQDEEEREYAEQNLIPVGGETLESDDTESDDTEYEKDSFLVSSAEEDHDLLSGSGDDLSLSDNDLKMTPRSKKKYDERKTKEQKNASREMYESRHGNKTTALSDESVDGEVVTSSKNRKRNRLRLDSSKDSFQVNQEETEISIMGNNSISDKDPLSVAIKQEILEVSSANHTILEPIENVKIDQDMTVYSNEESVNPLNSFINPDYNSDSEGSDDGGIAHNYSSLLQHLKSDQSQQNCIRKVNKSLGDEEKKSKNINNESILEKLNVTQEKKKKSPLKIEKNISDDYIFLKNGDNEAKVKALDETRSKVTETESQAKQYKHRKNSSFTELKDSKNKKDISLLDKLNLTSSGREKKNKKMDSKKGIMHADNISSVGNVSINNKNDVVDSPTGKQVDITDSKSKALKHDNSYTDQSKDESSTNRSTKLFKSKTIQNQEAIQPAQSTIDDSSDSIDFKLLFETEDKSDDAPFGTVAAAHPELNEEKSYPLKRSEGKTNIFNSSSSSVTPGTNLELLSTKTLKKKKGQKSSVIKLTGKEENGNLDTNEPVKSRKRKDRDNDIAIENNKIFKTSFEKKIGVQRLPASILDKLEHQPQKLIEGGMKIVTATSTFQVETLRRRGMQPSLYLEDSIHIDSMTVGPPKAQEKILKRPKLMKSIPKPSTSNVGFTTNFKVNVLKQEKRQDAKLTGPFGEFVNFKTERLYGPTIKRIAADDLCRKQKRLKTTRF